MAISQKRLGVTESGGSEGSTKGGSTFSDDQTKGGTKTKGTVTPLKKRKRKGKPHFGGGREEDGKKWGKPSGKKIPRGGGGGGKKGDLGGIKTSRGKRSQKKIGDLRQ